MESNSFREGRCFSPHAILLVGVSAATALPVACLLLQRNAFLAQIILTLRGSRSHKFFKTWRAPTWLFHWRHQGCSLRSGERVIASPRWHNGSFREEVSMLSRFLNGGPLPRSIVNTQTWEKLARLSCMRLSVTRKRV